VISKVRTGTLISGYPWRLSRRSTIQEVVGQQTGGQRFTTVLLSLFALSGLALAMVGSYGVISFLVAQRQQELAVLIAVGASRGNVLWPVLKKGLTMAAIGAALGLLRATAAEKMIKGLLFGIPPRPGHVRRSRHIT